MLYAELEDSAEIREQIINYDLIFFHTFTNLIRELVCNGLAHFYPRTSH